MSSNYEHTTKFKADISSLKQGITQANKELKKIASEYKATSSAAELSGKKQDQLKAKLEYLTKTLEQQNKKLQTYKDQLKTTQDYTQKLGEKEQELTKKLEDAKQKFGANSTEVQKYQKELTAVQKEITSNKDKMDKLNITINNQQAICNNAAKELQDFGKEAEDMGYKVNSSGDDIEELGQGLEGIDGAVTAASTALDGLGGIVDSLTDKFENLLINGIKKVSEGLVTLTSNVFEGGGSFEKEISLVEAHFGSNLTGSIDEVIAKSQELGANTSKTALEVAEAFDVLAKAGMTSADAIAAMDSIVELSLGTQEDMVTMTTTLKNSLLKFDIAPTLENVTHIADVLASASTNADTTVALLGESLDETGGMAASLGYEFEDTILALDMMAKYGLNGQRAGTALKRIFISMIKPTDSLNTLIEKYGFSLFKSNGEAKELTDVIFTLRDVLNDPAFTDADRALMEVEIGGARAVESLALMAKLSEKDFNNLQDAIYDCDGAAAQMAETAQDNLLGSFDILTSAIDGVYMALYSKLSDPAREGIDALADAFSSLVVNITSGNLAPYLTQVGDAISRVANSLPGLFEEHGPALEKFAQNFCLFLVEIINLLPSLVDTILPKVLDMLTKIMEEAPGLIEEWAPKIIDLIGFILENLPLILTILYSLKGLLAIFKTILAGLGIGALISKLGALFGTGGALASAGGMLSGLISTLGTFGGAILTFVGHIAGVVAFFTGMKVLTQELADAFLNAFPSVKEFFTNLQNEVSNFSLEEFVNNISEKLSLAKDVIEVKFAIIKNNISKKVEEIKTNISEFFETLPEKVAYWLGYVIGAIGAFCVNAYNNFVIWIDETGQKINTFFTELPEKIDKWFFDTLNKIDAFKENAITSIKEWIDKTKEEITYFFDDLPNKVKAWFDEVIARVVEWGTNLYDTATTWVSDTCDDIVSWFEELPSKLETTGKNIIDGLINGIESKWNDLKDTVGSFVSGIKEGFTDNLDIHSPSRWMRDFIGKNLVRGLELGITTNEDSLFDTLTGLNDLIMSSFNFEGLSNIQYGLAAASGSINSVGSSNIVNHSTSSVTYNPTFNYNKPLNSREIYRQNKNMLSSVLNK